ncbi:phosphatidylinositol alpha-mannosyltransferase [Stackebrandtia albiflava]|uniref:Phosphatidylinositol alpha-mannosyltransferase n=1 Tax=Stackebrandtia albiflava TaxID=406432 RepID=A0A562VE80_9ACTN|nr:glycosyltransferase family 4 protein [Stackebrandtia albiflava]TWJ16175.1 phosphatidylinositol alpha-mannosyltransferase [Stackebrandtia albiflava]
MKIGIVSPYSFAVPGGVQGHIRDLAETLTALGHGVSVLAPAERDDPVPDYVVPAGRAIPVPYNGSVARLAFGPIAATRVRKWLRAGDFDVLHVHEPLSPSLSLLACLSARGPVVATFHTAMTRSRTLAAGKGVAQLVLEKITARIAVSALARRVQVEHLGGGAVEIPNGVMASFFVDAEPLPGWPGEGGALGFVGRFTEPRKGFGILKDAFVELAGRHPGVRLLVLGPGEPAEVLESVPADVADRIEFLGMASDEVKARMLRSVDVYVAPNTGGESFGMILTEAMAAGTPVLASDLDAFRRVLDNGTAGRLFPVGDAAALCASAAELLDDARLRADLARRATEVVADYDWPVVARRVLEVYTAAIEASGGTVTEDEAELPEELRG